jgi:hypothetical protein
MDQNGTLDFGEFLSLMFLWTAVGEYKTIFTLGENAEIVSDAFADIQDLFKNYDRAGKLVLEQEEVEADHRFVRMTQSEFEAEKQRAKRDRRFGSWEEWRRWVERIDALRRPARVVKRQPTALEMLHAERLEIIRYPHAMFSTQEEMRAALEQVNAEILRLGGRVDRRDERTDEEREAVTSIEARLRQARAVKACRQFIAAATIARAVKRRFTK